MEPFLKDDVEYYQHQLDGVRQMMTMRNFLLADDMGLGKSLQAITVSVGDIVWEKGDTILVVAPVTLKGNWSDEFDKFTRINHIIFGQELDPKNPERLKQLTPAKRKDQLVEFAAMESPKALITNYEQILKHKDDLNRLNFHITIFDEAHYLKNPKAKRTQACHQLRSNRYFMLTGTPMLNRVDELWGVLHLIDPLRWGNYHSFRNRYCVFGGYQNKQIIGIKNEQELTKRLNEVMIRRLKKDVLDLPDVQTIKKRLDLLPAQQKLYDQAESEMQIPMLDQLEPSEIENALTKLLRLKQICGTTLAFTGQDESAKLDAAIEDAVELIENGHRIVVFTQFRDVLEAFCDRLDKALPDAPIWELHGDVPKHDRQPHVKDWSISIKPGAIVCMLQVAGVGLNMTASRHALFLDKLWTPGLNQQAVDRLHRIGASETQPVQVFEYLMRGTVETRVEQILNAKSKLFGTIVNDVDFKKALLAQLAKKAA